MASDFTDSGAGAAARFDTVLERSFAAPRALVFAAWTDANHLAHWWGPHGFTNPVCRFDARVGGGIHIDMRGPDGTVYPMTGQVREITPPARLVFVSAPLDNDGRPVFEVETTVDFSEAAGNTTIKVQARVISAGEGAELYLSGMEQGWGQSLDRLAAYVSQLLITGAGK